MNKSDNHLDHQTGSSHGSVASYIIGFILSIVLTLIAFYLVSYEVFTPANRILSIIILAIIQLYVQVVFFLHLNFSSEARWNLLSFIFTVIVVLVVVLGSLWIMFSLNYNMMMVH